jgi:hypothetical protein
LGRDRGGMERWSRCHRESAEALAAESHARQGLTTRWDRSPEGERREARIKSVDQKSGRSDPQIAQPIPTDFWETIRFQPRITRMTRIGKLG